MRYVFFTNPWASAKIRGEQVAARLENAVVNPKHIHCDDMLICVKCCPNKEIADYVSSYYLDIVDSVALAERAKDMPHIGVIAIGVTAHRYLTKLLGRDDIILIPEHHCNFKNEVRDRPKVERVGFCGYTENFHLQFGAVSTALASIDVEFVTETQMEDRVNVCNFYKSIDVQLCFRKPGAMYASQFEPALKNPLKLANAGSFKIPTIAYPEMSYVAEWDGCFIRAENLDQIVSRVKILKGSEAAYESIAETAYAKAQEYHIDKIIPLYKELIV